MQNQAETFRRDLCNLITGKNNRRVRKDLLLKYHRMATHVDDRIRILNREELRHISSYYMNFHDQSAIILNAIQGMIEQGEINYEDDMMNLSSLRIRPN